MAAETPSEAQEFVDPRIVELVARKDLAEKAHKIILKKLNPYQDESIKQFNIHYAGCVIGTIFDDSDDISTRYWLRFNRIIEGKPTWLWFEHDLDNPGYDWMPSPHDVGRVDFEEEINKLDTYIILADRDATSQGTGRLYDFPSPANVG